MSTLAQMRSTIADKLNRTDLNSQITTEINRAIEHYYNSERFWFNETTGTFSTVASQESYTSSDAAFIANIREIDYVKITLSSTNHQPLTLRTFQELQIQNQGRSTGQPTDYAWYQSSFYLYLIPNNIWTITVFYTKTYSDLSADADTNDYTAYAEDLIEAHVMAAMYDDYLFDPAKADRMRIKRDTALQALRSRTSAADISTNQIQPTAF